MSRRDKPSGLDHRTAGMPDLDALQGPIFLVAVVAGFVYLIRIAQVLGHPLEHIIGILCWTVMLGCALLRLAWEQKQGSYPLRYGGLFVLILAFLIGIGLLVEIAVATRPAHTENQPYSVF